MNLATKLQPIIIISAAQLTTLSSTALARNSLLSLAIAVAAFPDRLLISLRMKRAKELLHSTDMTVKEISMSVGYYNDSSFIRQFKQHEGVTPNEFRFKC